MIIKTYKSSADPIVWFAVLFVVFLLVGITATLLSLYQDQAAGELQAPYYFMTKSDATQPFEHSISPFTTLSMSSNTSFLPAENEHGELQGVVMLGDGILSIQIPGKDLIQYPVEEVYIPMGIDAWITLENQHKTSLTSLTNSEISSARKLTDQRHFLTFSYNLFGYTRLYPIKDQPPTAILYSQQDDLFRLTHGDQIQLDSWKKGTLHRAFVGDSTSSSDSDLGPPEATQSYSTFYILLYTISIMVLSLIFAYVTTAHFPKTKPKPIYIPMERIPNRIYAAAIVLSYLVITPMLEAAFNIHSYTVIGCFYLLMAPILRSHSIREALNIRPIPLISRIFSAILLAAGIQIISSLQIPSSIRWVNDLDFPLWAQTFLAISVLHELYWRGIVQNYFREVFGIKMAVGLTAFTMLIYAMMTSFSASGFSDFDEEILQFGLLLPIQLFITAYFYERVRNIWASAVLHTLLVILPTILIVL
jgi:membrane protease YdiL (CAAX protease family)